MSVCEDQTSDVLPGGVCDFRGFCFCSSLSQEVTPSRRGASRRDGCAMCVSRTSTTPGLSARVSSRLSDQVTELQFHLSGVEVKDVLLSDVHRVQDRSSQGVWRQGKPDLHNPNPLLLPHYPLGGALLSGSNESATCDLEYETIIFRMFAKLWLSFHVTIWCHKHN